MRAYHPESWSQQARKMSNKYIRRINRGELTIEEAIKRISNSYRHPLIVRRAAKHFGRKVREGKVHERSELDA